MDDKFSRMIVSINKWWKEHKDDSFTDGFHEVKEYKQPPEFVTISESIRQYDDIILEFVGKNDVLRVYDFMNSMGIDLKDDNTIKYFALCYCELSSFGNEVIDLYIFCKNNNICIDEINLFSAADKNEALDYLNDCIKQLK